MEYYQIVQSRAYQTVAVLNNFTAGIKVGGITADGLQSQAEALTPLAQTRDDAINTEGASANAEHLGQTQLHTLVVQLPKVAEGELNDAVPEETALIDSLAPVYAIQPSTTALVLERGMRLKSALGPINTYLAAQVPVRGPITSGGKGLADLAALITAQPDLIQDKDDKQADVSSTRSALHAAAAVVDRLNKRFYAKLEAEAATQPALAAALKEAIRGQEKDLGIFICGGKGKTSRKTPDEIQEWGERLALPGAEADNLVYNSKMSAKVDSALVQDGFQLYHHSF